MDVLKYFYEEPAALETLAPDLDPDARRREGAPLSLEALLGRPAYHRGYLAGTDLVTGWVGLTALAHPEAFTAPLLDWLAGLRWMRATKAGAVEALDEEAVQRVLRNPARTAVLAAGKEAVLPEVLMAAAKVPRRQALPALRRLLETAGVAFFPEPAHHGFDWSFFASLPAREALVGAFERHPCAGVRRFVLPYQKARSEEKFYFETWQLDDLPVYVEEV